jgi:hypothetical protein
MSMTRLNWHGARQRDRMARYGVEPATQQLELLPLRRTTFLRCGRKAELPHRVRIGQRMRCRVCGHVQYFRAAHAKARGIR